MRTTIYRRAFTLNGVRKPYRPILDRRHPLSRGLIACLLLGDDINTAIMEDISGYRNYGAMNGYGAYPAAYDSSHHGGKSIKTTATTFVNSPTDSLAGLFTNDVLSICAWFKASASQTGGIVFVGNTTGANEWGLIQVALQIWAISQNAGGNKQAVTGNITTGVWHHGAAVFSASNSRSIYLNGVFVQTNTESATVAPTNKTLVIGKRYGAAQAFTGSVEGVRIYNRALSSSEIAKLYREPYAGIVDHWLPSLVGVLPSFIPAWAAQSNPPVLGAGTY